MQTSLPNPSIIKTSLALRLKVYGICLFVLLVAGALGFLADTQFHSKPAFTLIAVIVTYPFVLFLITHFVARTHGVGTPDNK